VIAVPPDVRRALREQVRSSARNLPGTYRMVGADGEVLYVGKSKQVRTRLLSYFRARRGEKGRRILEHACRLEWEYEPSEFAALLGELRLIKKLRPRFNVQHKRDGRFSFLKLTGGAAPRLLVTHHVADDSATYFGPFRGGRRIEEAVRELNDVLGLRDCALNTPIFFADQQDLFALDRPPRCHRLEMQRCAGPCAARCTRADYMRRMKLARAFLDGNADEPLHWLAERMQRAVDRWDFEHAATVRDRIRRLELLRDEFARLRDALDSLSFLYPVPGADGDDRVYLIRRGTVRASLPAPRDEAGRRELERLSHDQYGAPEVPSALVTRHQVDEILLLSRWFRLHPRERERAVPPDRAATIVFRTPAGMAVAPSIGDS
jgi:excinuclease ABC subunit C